MHAHVNGTQLVPDTPLINIQFCEGKYGGIAHGMMPLGVHLPEHLNSFSGVFIAWCGLHMLLFNQHDDLTLKVVAALFCLNGGASFLYHWTGYDSALAIDGYLMMNAVWLTTGFVLEELTAHMIDGPVPWDGVCHKGLVIRRLIRTLYWLVVTCIPALFLLALERPWRSWVANISPWFIGAFITPLVLMLTVNVILMLSGARGFPPPNPDLTPNASHTARHAHTRRLPDMPAAVEDVSFEHYPSIDDGIRAYGAARARFFWGLTLVLFGVGAWLLSEGLCDQIDVFKVFPGHAIFHVLMALGLTNCLVYPATLRARTYGSHVRFLIDSPRLNDVPSLAPHWRLLRGVLRLAAKAYLFAFPGYTFVRSASLVTTATRTSAAMGASIGAVDDGHDVAHVGGPKKAAPASVRIPPDHALPSSAAHDRPSPTRSTPPRTRAHVVAAETPEARRLQVLEARMAMLEQQSRTPSSQPSHTPSRAVSPNDQAYLQGRGGQLPPPAGYAHAPPQQDVHQAV